MPKTIATTPSWYWPEGVPRVLGIPPYSLEELLVDRWATRHALDHPLLVCGDERMNAPALAAHVATAARAIDAIAAPEAPVVVSAGSTAHGAALVLGALASGHQVLLVPPGGETTLLDSFPKGGLALGDATGAARLKADGYEVIGLDALEARAPAGETRREPDGTTRLGSRPAANGVDGLRGPVACMAGRYGPVWHSHRSLLAGAVALRAFLGTTGGTSWLTTFSPCTWDGLLGLSTALLAGSSLVLAEAGEAARVLTEAEHPVWLLASLSDALSTWASGRRRRGTEGIPRAALVTVDGPFDPDQRRAVTAGSGADALTLFGMAETGLILASHPSWYLDESVGIPVPNMHVVPADPYTGEPISAMWELVDHAMVTAWSPSLATAHDGPRSSARDGRRATAHDGRFVTGVLAASDPNGMLYLIDEL